jgi:lipopolysaccharide transport system permease protein
MQPTDSSSNLMTVYGANSPNQGPLKILQSVIADAWKCRELTWILYSRDTKAAYRQSVLGFFWMFIPIIAPTLVWTFLSTTRVLQSAETPIPYPLYVMLGLLTWNLFTSSLNQPLASFNEGQGIFMKICLPPESFILAGILKVFTDTLIRLIVLIPMFAIFQVIPPYTAIFFPIALFATGFVGSTLGILMIPFGSLFGDIPRIFGTGIALAMYATPILYPPPTSGFASEVIKLNPLTPLIMVTRDVLTIGTTDYLIPFLIIVTVSAVMFLIGIILLRTSLPHLIERMGM